MVAGRRAGKTTVVAVLGVLALVTAGCNVVRGTVSTAFALEDAGFSSPDINLGGSDAVRVTVEKDAEDLDAAAAEAAGVVWRKLPLRIDRLEVTCGNGFGGRGRFAADRADLEQRFGARDPDLDQGIVESDVRNILLAVAGVLVLGLVVLIGIIVLVVVLSRRNRGGPPPGPPGPPGPPTGWGPGPQGPPPGYRPQP